MRRENRACGRMKSSHNLPNRVVKTEEIEQDMKLGFFVSLAKKASIIWIAKAAKDESH